MHIHVGACNWQHNAWSGSFYPEDLPEEWRLTYYANEFHTVLVPVSVAKNLNKEKIQEFCDDVGDEFKFFYAVDDKLGSTAFSNVALTEIDCSFVAVNFTQSKTKMIFNDVVIEQAQVIRAFEMSEEISVLRVTSEDVINPKAGRQLIEKVCADFNQHETVYLFLDGHLNNIESLKMISSIIELMGVSS